jgi:hypothetical protein
MSEPKRLSGNYDLYLPPGTPILVFIPSTQSHVPYQGWYRAKSDHYWWRIIASHWMHMPDDPTN